MQLEAHQTRSTAEITELIDDLTTEYLRGGPKRDYFLDGCGFVHNGNWDPDEAYHLIVWALAQGDDEDTLERALVWGHIETSGGLRDLLSRRLPRRSRGPELGTGAAVADGDRVRARRGRPCTRQE